MPPSDFDGNASYEFGLAMAKKAGAMIKDAFRRPKTVDTKTCDIDFVTDTDRAVEKMLLSEISARFPTHKFIGEEASADGTKNSLTAEPTWIIDPIDGTMNFIHRYPLVCVSIGLWVDKEPFAGFVFNPILDLFYSARKNEGAFLNGKRLHVSDTTSLSQSLVMFELGTARDPAKRESVIENFNRLLDRGHGFRSMGTCALNMCAVAEGGADAYFEYGVHSWDVAAGSLIVREAGGYVCDPSGGDLDVMSRRMLCAASPVLAHEICSLLFQIYPERDD
ncbi:unnamed protein product [Darwinula stevensoni]|uniref:Inositol-1-monophosphatase n=1 Tax=Darwinula stevensoni TaxID=69355 RepID=A0A7R8XB75_9CRUS|nr:unnamed protein product [Darwinula stevensoni]CAG0887440.1 unnamed protein product [Darwinula stevensoni]